MIYSLSMVPHVGLYAKKQDRVILYSQSLGLLVFFFGVLYAEPNYGVVAIPWSLCFAFLTILTWKLVAFWKVCRSENDYV